MASKYSFCAFNFSKSGKKSFCMILPSSYQNEQTLNWVNHIKFIITLKRTKFKWSGRWNGTLTSMYCSSVSIFIWPFLELGTLGTLNSTTALLICFMAIKAFSPGFSVIFYTISNWFVRNNSKRCEQFYFYSVLFIDTWNVKYKNVKMTNISFYYYAKCDNRFLIGYEAKKKLFVPNSLLMNGYYFDYLS